VQDSELRATLALRHARGIGPVKYQTLLQHFPNANQALQHLLQNDHLSGIDEAAIERDLAWAQQTGNHLVIKGTNRYPAALAEIPDAPVTLYVRGNVNNLSTTQLAIVGSRNPSPDGCRTASEFARALSKTGLTITSGLASGIDAAAHQGCVHAHGKTIAVFGTGIDEIYPRKHLTLAEQILENDGTLVSEYPAGSPVSRQNFPRRNRIISGLSAGTLIVEASLRSGSLITARLASEQGREVFAIPGSIHNPLTKGCHSLIKQGAKLVESIEDICEELYYETQTLMSKVDITPKKTTGTDELDELMSSLLDHISYNPTSIDDIIHQSGLSAQSVTSSLLVLELQGFVQSLPGGLFSKINAGRSNP